MKIGHYHLNSLELFTHKCLIPLMFEFISSFEIHLRGLLTKALTEWQTSGCYSIFLPVWILVLSYYFRQWVLFIHGSALKVSLQHCDMVILTFLVRTSLFHKHDIFCEVRTWERKKKGKKQHEVWQLPVKYTCLLCTLKASCFFPLSWKEILCSSWNM